MQSKRSIQRSAGSIYFEKPNVGVDHIFVDEYQFGVIVDKSELILLKLLLLFNFIGYFCKTYFSTNVAC